MCQSDAIEISMDWSLICRMNYAWRSVAESGVDPGIRLSAVLTALQCGELQGLWRLACCYALCALVSSILPQRSTWITMHYPALPLNFSGRRGAQRRGEVCFTVLIIRFSLGLEHRAKKRRWERGRKMKEERRKGGNWGSQITISPSPLYRTGKKRARAGA